MTTTLPPNWNWQDSAECRGTEVVLFFGPDGERQPEREIREREAKAVCAGCVVRPECLAYAVSRPEKYGTWGALNEDERASGRRRVTRRANDERKAAERDDGEAA
jgi:WhiB family redox-sensing transcriptional regulator